jgi:hypothetical protein
MNHDLKTANEPGYIDTTELLILEDGQILVHNLTPEFAQLLEGLNAWDTTMHRRAGLSEPTQTNLPRRGPC